MIRAIPQPAGSLPQGLRGGLLGTPRERGQEGPGRPLERGRRFVGSGGKLVANIWTPRPLPQLWPQNWQPEASQAGGETAEDGAGAREIPEHVARPGIHAIDMQIKRKLVLFPPHPSKIIRWGPCGSRACPPPASAGLPLLLQAPMFASGKLLASPTNTLES